MAPAVSVVIPVLDEAGSIEAALGSVFGAIPAAEIVVVDRTDARGGSQAQSGS